MATDRDFVEYIHAQTGLGRELSYRKMFGEYSLYLDGKVIGFAADNSLFLKSTVAAKELLPRVVEGHPYPGAKLHLLLDEFLDDSELLQRLFRVSAAELPLPSPKKPKKLAQGSGGNPGKAP